MTYKQKILLLLHIRLSKIQPNYMNLRVFTRLVICCLAFLMFNISCNSDSTYNLGEFSSDAQITSFNIDAIPRNAADSARFPALSKTAFSIINKNSYLIFNMDSLPEGIHLDSLKLKLTLTYSTTPTKIDLVYKDMHGNDSIPEESWNTTDSVQFFKKNNDGYYWPEMNVVAADGTERRYSIIYNIHKSDPDSIRWMREVGSNKQPVNLLKVGENKTIANADKTTLYSLTNDGTSVYLYSSKMNGKTIEWENLTTTNLPTAGTLVKSFQLIDGFFVVADKDGKLYSAKEATDWSNWTEYSSNHISAILGSLPDLEDHEQNNLLLVLKKEQGANVFAKAKVTDLANPIELSFLSPAIPEDFPLSLFASMSGEGIGLGKEYLVVTGGKNAKDEIINRSWVIRELADNRVEAIRDYRDDLAEYKHGVTTFAYTNEMYMISNDTTYTSKGYGTYWKKVDKKRAFQEEIIKDGMDMPSVVVDKENFILIFGGKLKKGDATYSDKIWRGRLNRLTHKRIK